MCRISDEIREEGRLEGRLEGKLEERHNIIELMQELFATGRVDDLKKKQVATGHISTSF